MANNYKTITEIPGWFNEFTNDGVPNNVAVLYRQVPYLFRAVQLRADGLASIPIKVYKNEEEVSWPYPTSIQDLLWKWESSMMLAGAAYGEIVKNKAGIKKDVIYRNPFDMVTSYDKTGKLLIRQNSSGAEWVNDLYKGIYNIIYISEFDPTQDILPGVGSGISATVDAKLLMALSKFPEMYFEGGAMPVTLLGIDSVDSGEIKRVENWFKRSATAIKNAFRVLGIRAGSITPTTLTPPLKDLAMPEISDAAKENISVAFGIPKTMLDSEAANYATAKEDRKSYYQETLWPRARKYEAALNEQLLARDGLRLEFKLNELDLFQEDENERADIILKLSQAGLPTLLALDLAGVNLTDEQRLLLDNEPELVETSPELAELRRWQRMAEKRVREGKTLREFETDKIEPALQSAIAGALENVKSVDDVRNVFETTIAWRNYP